MSYSRWSNSRWYTYHSCDSGETREEQVFTVCTVRDFTFDDIKQDILGCARACCDEDESKNSWYSADKAEAQFWELAGLMAAFMEDMEYSSFPAPGSGGAGGGDNL